MHSRMYLLSQMAPKKVTKTAPVVAPVTEQPQDVLPTVSDVTPDVTPDATPEAPSDVQPVASKVKKPRVTKPKTVVANDDVPETSTTDAPLKRNVSAVSVDFANTVKNALSFDNITQKQCKEVCEVFLQVIVNKVKAGETVSFINNMTFKRQIRSGRTYKNLKTGDTINKPKHFVLTMQVRPALKKVFDEIEVDAAAPSTPPQVSQ